MRIGIEAQRIFRKKKHGMDFVALETIRNLLSIDSQNEYFIFINEREDEGILELPPNAQLVYLKPSLYPVWEQKHLHAATIKYKLDLLHCTSNTGPVACPVPLFVTLHDIIYMEKLHLVKGSKYQRLGNLYRRWNVPKVVAKAQVLFTVSEFERQRIINQFNLPHEKVVVTYNGIGQHFKPSSSDEIEIVMKKYELPYPYILFLGNTDPKKNLDGVLEALKILYKKEEFNHYKVVMPDFGKVYLEKMLSRIDASHLLDKIHLTGYIPNLELPAIYSNAAVFLYPSRRESFGIPILEAMACGCPVITSNTSSMPEVAGDAAEIIDPYQPVSISNAIIRILGDDKYRKTLITKGFERHPKFSYRQAAEIILSNYQKILSHSK
jgi:glycosyltransferase involved in cell wall biosynthesis